PVGQQALQIARVVVMGAKGNVGVFQARISSLDHADNVASVTRIHDLIIRVQIKCDCDSFQREFRQVLLLLSFCLQVGVLEIRTAEKEIEKLVARGNGWRDHSVQTLGRREVGLRRRSPSALRPASGCRRAIAEEAAPTATPAFPIEYLRGGRNYGTGPPLVCAVGRALPEAAARG